MQIKQILYNREGTKDKMKLLIWVVIIFICAATFRLTNLDLIEFKLDEANTFYGAVKFYSEPYLAQNSGVSSSTLYNMPFFYYLITMLAAPFKNPQAISFLIGLINSIMVVLFYLIVRKYYNNLTAVFASFLMASSPWMIIYSRKIWGPDLILLFAVPFFYFLHRLILDKKPGAVFGLSLSLILLIQLHYSGLLLFLITVVVIAVYKIHFSWKGLILGILLGLIPLVPYLTMGTFTCVECIAFQPEKTFDVSNLFRGLQIINGSYFENVLGDDFPVFLDQFPFAKISNFLFIFEFFLIPFGVWAVIKDRKYSFLLWYLSIPLIYLITQTPSRMYYFLILSPIVILLYGLGIFALRSHLIQGATLIIIILINVIFLFSFYQFLSEKKVIQGDFGPIFSVTQKVAEEKLAGWKNSPEYNLIKADFYLRLLGNQITP